MIMHKPAEDDALEAIDAQVVRSASTPRFHCAPAEKLLPDFAI
jgi:hypothetical protein